MAHTLLLDPDIRDWVVIPLFLIMIIAGLLRHHVGVLLMGEKKPLPAMAQRGQNLLSQVNKIRSSSSHYMTTWQWHVRKQHYAKLLRDEADWMEAKDEEDESADPMEAMMANPLGMMKGNMAFMVQNMVMMQGIQHFFSGFILLKIPFPLTAGFKNMFQRGLVDLPDLEPSYVSSVSWYFLVMYGLRGFFKLAIGEPSLEAREQDFLQSQLGLQNPPNNPNLKQDAESVAKMLRQEADNLEIILHNHKSELDTVEKRLLGSRMPRRKFKADNDIFSGSGKKPKRKAQ